MAKKSAPKNVFIAPLSAKKCECGEKSSDVVSVGEYIRGKYRRAFTVCPKCADGQLRYYDLTQYNIVVRWGYSHDAVQWLIDRINAYRLALKMGKREYGDDTSINDVERCR